MEMEPGILWCFTCKAVVRTVRPVCPNCQSQVLQQDSKAAREFTPFRWYECRRPSMKVRYRLNQNPLNLVQPFQSLARQVRQYLVSLEAVEGGSPPADAAVVARLPRVELTDVCVICKQQGGRGLMMPCGHGFHGQCIGPWLQRHSTCPSCRQSL